MNHRCPNNHMLVRYDMPLRIDDHTRPQTVGDILLFHLRSAAAKEPIEKLIEEGIGQPPEGIPPHYDGSLGIDIYHCRGDGLNNLNDFGLPIRCNPSQNTGKQSQNREKTNSFSSSKYHHKSPVMSLRAANVRTNIKN